MNSLKYSARPNNALGELLKSVYIWNKKFFKIPNLFFFLKKKLVRTGWHLNVRKETSPCSKQMSIPKYQIISETDFRTQLKNTSKGSLRYPSQKKSQQEFLEQ